MTTSYPTHIDGYSNIRIVRDGIEEVLARDHNDNRSAIIAVEQSLGISPQGPFGTVSARLDFLETGITTTGGDLSGLLPNPTVVGLQGRDVSSTAPNDGYALVWNQSDNQWEPNIGKQYSVKNMATLRTLTGNQYQTVVLDGYYTPGDGGGGEFVWSNTVAADDGGTIINPTGGTSAGWRRIYSGALNVKWFGAYGDGVHDDLAAINHAIEMCLNAPNSNPALVIRTAVSKLYLPSGNYRITGSVKIWSVVSFSWEGVGHGQSILVVDGNVDAALDLNGVALGEFQGIAISSMGSGQMNVGVRYYWNPATSAFASTNNRFYNTRIINAKYKVGIQIGSDLSDSRSIQEDQTYWYGTTVVGYTAGLDPTWWQEGIRAGSGVFGNNLLHQFYGTTVAGNTYGVRVAATQAIFIGGNNQSNGTDWYFNNGISGYVKVVGFRSEESQRFIVCHGLVAAAMSAQFEDCLFVVDSGMLPVDGKIVIWDYPGSVQFKNLNVPGVGDFSIKHVTFSFQGGFSFGGSVPVVTAIFDGAQIGAGATESNWLDAPVETSAEIITRGMKFLNVDGAPEVIWDGERLLGQPARLGFGGTLGPADVFVGRGSEGYGSGSLYMTTPGGLSASAGPFGLGSNKVSWMGAPPISGTWAKGDIIWNTGASVNESAGWVCTTAGSPGIWETFGLISISTSNLNDGYALVWDAYSSQWEPNIGKQYSVKNMATLRTLTGNQYQTVTLDGYYTAGDGGGGEFVWSNTVAADDVGTIVNPTGGTSAGWRRIYSGPVDVRWFGVNTLGDSTAAFQKVFDSVDTIYIPHGSYLITDTVTIFRPDGSGRVNICGDGPESTRINFVPTSGGKAAFHFQSSGSGTIFGCSMKHLSLFSTDSTLQKTGIYLADVSRFVLDEIVMNQFTGNVSVGLHIAGRELSTFSRLEIFADLPIKISQNIHHSGPSAGPDLDVMHFQDISLSALNSSQANILLEDNVVPSNVTISGSNILSGGQHGIYYYDTSSVSIANNIHIEGIRWEAPGSGYFISLERTAAVLQHVTIDRCYSFTAGNGFRLAAVESAVLINSRYAGSGIALNLGASNLSVLLLNTRFDTPSTIFATGYVEVFGSGKFASTYSGQVLSLYMPSSFALAEIATTIGGAGKRMVSSTTPPVTETWNVGDIVWNISPSAGGTSGWICTTGGTPGIWETFGLIGISTSNLNDGYALVWDSYSSQWEPNIGKQYSVKNMATLRALTGNQYQTVTLDGYYTPGDGGGGEFVWSNTVAADDVGTIVNPTGGTAAGWRRIYSGEINVKWFGAKGDGISDDIIALQRAVNESANSHRSLFVPVGTYMISSPLTVFVPAGATIHMRGHDRAVSIIKAMSVMDSVLLLNGVCSGCYFEDFKLDANSLANFGLKGASTNHSTLHRLAIFNALTAGASLSYGWCNEIEYCMITGCADGIWLNGISANNADRIINSKIFNNSGFGIRLLADGLLPGGTSSINTQIIGNTIEACLKGGIYLVGGIWNCIIRDNYFESVGEGGFTFSTPSKTIKSIIFINGSDDPTLIKNTIPAYGTVIEGNTVLTTLAVDTFVFLASAYETRCSGNFLGGQIPCVLIYSDTRYGLCDNLKIEDTTFFFGLFDRLIVESINSDGYLVDYSDTIIDGANSTTKDRTIHRNYLQGFTNVNIISGSNGSLLRTLTQYEDHEIFEITGITGESTHFGWTIDTAANPELADKPLYFSIANKTSVNNLKCLLETSIDGYVNTVVPHGDTDWHIDSICFKSPPSGTFTIEFYSNALSVSDIAYFSRPILSFVGTPPAWYHTPPTMGTQDAVYNSIPPVSSSLSAGSSKTLSLRGTRANGANNVSVDVVGDVNNPTIDTAHKVFRVGWENNSQVFTELMNVKESEWELQSSTSAKVLSSEADGGSVTAVTLGSENSFITPGAKLLSIVNGAPDGYERMSVDYAGDISLVKGNNAQYLGLKYLTEVYTVPAAADGYSTIQIPDNCLVIGLNIRVITAIPTAATFSVGISGNRIKYLSGISTNVGTTSVSLINGIHYNSSITSLVVTPNTAPATATGVVRLTFYYFDLTPPVS